MDPKELQQPKTRYLVEFCLEMSAVASQLLKLPFYMHQLRFPAVKKLWTLDEPSKTKFLLSPLDKLVVQDFEEHHKPEENGRFIREVKHDVYGKRQTAGLRLPLAVCRFDFLRLSFACTRKGLATSQKMNIGTSKVIKLKLHVSVPGWPEKTCPKKPRREKRTGNLGRARHI